MFGSSPPLRALTDDARRALGDLLDRRTQLVAMRAQEKNRLSTVTVVARKNVEQHIAWLDMCIAKLDAEMGDRLKKSPVWSHTAELLDSAPGGGDVTTMSLLAKLPELASVSRQKTSALVGLAPFPDDRGKRVGARYIRGGRA